jgi:hypothetical protein
MTLPEVARLDIGKKEKPGNSGFIDSLHEKELRAVGWQPGWAWCAGQVEAWVWKAFPSRISELRGLFVPSAVQTFKNLKQAGYNVSMIPTVGSIVFWQHYSAGKAEWTGHTGVVVEATNSTSFKSIEGNTNEAGGRNGDGVYLKSRTVKSDVQDGLKVIGFVTI